MKRIYIHLFLFVIWILNTNIHATDWDLEKGDSLRAELKYAASDEETVKAAAEEFKAIMAYLLPTVYDKGLVTLDDCGSGETAVTTIFAVSLALDSLDFPTIVLVEVDREGKAYEVKAAPDSDINYPTFRVNNDSITLFCDNRMRLSLSIEFSNGRVIEVDRLVIGKGSA